MKKILMSLIVILSSFIMTACLGNLGPSERVESLFNKYIMNDVDIMKELDTYLDKQELNEVQKNRYKDIIKDEYKTIKYEITSEKIEEDTARVDAEIVVKDLYKASSKAENYLIDNPTEFYTDGIYDSDKFIDYKLSVMENAKDTVTYNITIDLINDEGKWKIVELGSETLEKIHGIYNYETA